MFDPAILLEIQKAVAPPLMVPPAIERAWVSPTAERGERRVGAFVDAAEVEADQWRATLAIWTDALSRNRDVPRSESDLEALDRLLLTTSRQAQDMYREADRSLKRRSRFRKRLAEVDPSAAKALWGQMLRMHHLQLQNAEAIDRLWAAILDYRSAVDTRTGAAPGSNDKPLKPNATTIAAMQSARAGDLEPVTLDDLRAALLEVD